MLRAVLQVSRLVLELGIAVLLFWVVAPENRALFLSILGVLIALAAFVSAAKLDKTSLGPRIVLWAVVASTLAFLRFQIWRPRIESPSFDQTIVQFVLPSLGVIAVGATLNSAVLVRRDGRWYITSMERLAVTG
ncbi:MAG: hypothetical protein M1570_10355 [Chloroflexi bacterium]|nr:hypothetical protein [Chloroflexota bacterium]